MFGNEIEPTVASGVQVTMRLCVERDTLSLSLLALPQFSFQGRRNARTSQVQTYTSSQGDVFQVN